MRFVNVHMVHPYSSTVIATAWKKSHFILSDRSDFHMINNLLIAVHTFTRQMLTSHSVDEILLPRCVNLSTNFIGLPLKMEMITSCLKHMNSVLFVFTQRPMPPVACSRLCSRDLPWAGAFAKNAR